MKLERNCDNRGYTPLYAESLDPSLKSRGDVKETFYIGPPEKSSQKGTSNQWPPDVLGGTLSWKRTMESYHEKLEALGEKLLSLISLALNLDEDYFEKVGAYPPLSFIRLLHYPGEIAASDFETYGASAHSDYGMITLLATNGVPGLQICRQKDAIPRVWEDVLHVKGAFIVNIGDMLERWTNCLFRSTLHRVITVRQERYSVAFFFDPNPECLVQCMESCCSEMSPARFLPIRSGDYLQERFRVTYNQKNATH